MFPRAQTSNALGWVSIGCWILVYSPQILENYQLQSGDGLSVLFVVIWLFGDITNLVGAGLAGLLPTVIILAVYYTLCDIILLYQIYYYRWRSSRRSQLPISEATPLLPAPHKDSAQTWTSRYLQYVGGIAFVTTFGIVAWYPGATKDRDDNSHPEVVIDWQSQLLGWLSAVAYLGSRIPQILKNRQTKCQGLSLALFMFAILGNVTYVLSICVASMKHQNLVANAPWLAGSGLTVLLDFVVLGQFFYYRAEMEQLSQTEPQPHARVD